MQNSKFKILAAFYLFLIACLFLYSYTQVDLNLTMSKASVFQTIQKSFQNIGWFQRPLSASLYTTIIVILTIFYGLILRKAYKKEITRKQVWVLILATTGILLFSYNALSYDLFNYLFDARIFTFHNMNPYEHKALDFPQDPWINFMRWTHRTYPYGPVWLWITVPVSYLGMQFFLPTLFLFKILIASTYVGAVYFLEKIVKKINPSYAVFSVAFFALNPLVLVESLVSSHNEIVWIFLSLVAIYCLILKKHLRASIFLLLSVGIKFVSVFLVPAFLVFFILSKQKEEKRWNWFIAMATLGMTLAILFASYRTTFQPWYLLFVIPYAVFFLRKSYIFFPVFIGSIAGLLHYIPFLYTGNWDPPIPLYLFTINIVAGILSIGAIVLWRIIKKNYTVFA